MKVDFICKTDGNGLWSREKREVPIKKLGILYFHMDSDVGYHGELAAYFDARKWNLSKHGLIYTDKTWIKEFRKQLRLLGFSEKAVKSVDYSEQGMQGDNYVSMDAGEAFMKEWDKMEGLT